MSSPCRRRVVRGDVREPRGGARGSVCAGRPRPRGWTGALRDPHRHQAVPAALAPGLRARHRGLQA